jgi:hypothetical protein
MTTFHLADKVADDAHPAKNLGASLPAPPPVAR